MSTLQQIKLIELPKILDDRGNLTFFENKHQVPFYIKRVYWIYDVPGGQSRGGHAYKNSMEIIVALSGSFDVVTFDGENEKKFTLNRSYVALYLPSLTWRHIENFSTNALAFIATNTDYNKNDYIRDLQEFKQLQ